jgi:hypothetical protein
VDKESKMDDNFYILINPGGFDLDHLPANPQSITIQKTNGETLTLDPGQARLDISTEHPPVERMESDWGAICEVFRKSNTYYAAITGLRLAAGDMITIRYQGGPGTLTLKVIDIENGRARIEPPEITGPGGAYGDQ